MSRKRKAKTPRRGGPKQPAAATARPRLEPPRSAEERRRFVVRFAVGVLLWILPVAVVWVLLTPRSNYCLAEATESLVRLTESPSVTRLPFEPPHHVLVTRTDFPPSEGALSSVRLTDLHFPLIMLGAFFLAVPGVRWRLKLENLGWGLLASVFFHLVLALFWIKFIYATQLGAWSAEHYGFFGQTFWGMGKHLLDLAFKFALPFLLWCGFYLRLLLPPRDEADAAA